MVQSCKFLAAGALLALAIVAPNAAEAHPHVFVDARAEIVFDKTGKIAAVHNIWQFDAAFSAFAMQGLDVNHDHKYSADELKPLAKVNVDLLNEYEFFTWLLAGKERYKFSFPTKYWLELHGERLTLNFTLPLAEPVAPASGMKLEVFDPEYFVAFDFSHDIPARLIGAPRGCKAVYHPPHDLDAQTMAVLAAIPIDQHDIPPELRDAAAGLANLIEVACK